MKKAFFPGSFDPPTFGHLDIITRASSICDFLYVGVGSNDSKPNHSFSFKERIDLLKKITQHITNVEIISFTGLAVDCAVEHEISFFIRSIRSHSDFEQETELAYMNSRLKKIETLYLIADEKYRLMSSSLIKEIARHGHRLSSFVPTEIEEIVFNRLSGISSVRNDE